MYACKAAEWKGFAAHREQALPVNAILPGHAFQLGEVSKIVFWWAHFLLRIYVFCINGLVWHLACNLQGRSIYGSNLQGHNCDTSTNTADMAAI